MNFGAEGHPPMQTGSGKDQRVRERAGRRSPALADVADGAGQLVAPQTFQHGLHGRLGGRECGRCGGTPRALRLQARYCCPKGDPQLAQLPRHVQQLRGEEEVGGIHQVAK